jgi:hypothetical protein
MDRTTARTLGALAAASLALLLGACSSGDGVDPEAAPTTTVEDPDAEGDETEYDDGEAEVFDPSELGVGVDDDDGDDEDDEGSTGTTGALFESDADEAEFCSAAEDYADLLADDPFADEAATDTTLDEGNDLLEDLDFSIEDGPENEAIYAVQDEMLTLYEVGDDSGFDPDVVTSDVAYDAWVEANEDELAPVLADLCGVELEL